MEDVRKSRDTIFQVITILGKYKGWRRRFSYLGRLHEICFILRSGAPNFRSFRDRVLWQAASSFTCFAKKNYSFLNDTALPSINHWFMFILFRASGFLALFIGLLLLWLRAPFTNTSPSRRINCTLLLLSERFSCNCQCLSPLQTVLPPLNAISAASQTPIAVTVQCYCWW